MGDGFGGTSSGTVRENTLIHVRILLADDHDDFLACEVRLLEPEFEVVGTVGDGQALLDEAARLDPDVVVLDISMPKLNGIEAAQRLHAGNSRAKVVFVSVHDDSDYVRSAFAAGAWGFVSKCHVGSDLLVAVRESLLGRRFISPALTHANDVILASQSSINQSREIP